QHNPQLQHLPTRRPSDIEYEEKTERRDERLAGQELPDLVDCPCTSNGVADPAKLEVSQRNAQKMREQAAAENHLDAARRMREKLALEDIEDRVEHDHGQHPGGEHVQRAVAAVGKHLVDEDLTEERGGQREKLDG